MLKVSSLGLNVDQVVLNQGSCPISFFFWAWAPKVLDFQNEASTHPKCIQKAYIPKTVRIWLMISYPINIIIIYNLPKINLLSIFLLIYISMRLKCPLAYSWRNPSLGHARLRQVGAWQRKVSQIAHIHMHYCQRIHKLTTRSKYQGTTSKNSAKKRGTPSKYWSSGWPTNRSISA